MSHRRASPLKAVHLPSPGIVRRRVVSAAMYGAPAAFIGWLFVWPLFAILGRGLFPHGHVGIRAFADVFGDGRARRIVGFTLAQAAISTVGALVLGLPLAYCLERLDLRGRGIVRAIVMLPFALPTIVVGSAFASLFGDGSAFAALALVPSTIIIVIAHVYFNLAVVVRVVGARWAALDESLMGAASVLGASRSRATRTVTLPLLAPAIAGAASIVFLFCATSFGVVVVLGGSRQATIETEIYRLTTQELALNRASVLVIVQLAAVLVTIWLAAHFERSGAATRFQPQRASLPPMARRRTPSRSRFIGTAFAWTIAVFMAMPIAAVIVRSAADGALGYRMLFRVPTFANRPVAAVGHSLQAAAVATTIAIVIGTVSAAAIVRPSRGARVLNGLLLLPLGVSAVTIGFGFLIALDRPIDVRGWWLIVPLAQATVALPFVVRLLVPTLRGVDRRMRDAAAVLGARPARVLRTIDVPVVRRGLFGAAAFAAAISLGEFGATTFIARADEPTMPLEIAKLLGRPGSAPRAGAFALAVVLIVVTGLLVAVAERLSTERSGPD